MIIIKNECFKAKKSSLELWYETINAKNASEYSVDDICRMLRQDYLTSVAIPLGISMLKANPFCGNLFEAELLKCFVIDMPSAVYNNMLDFRDILSTAKVALLNNKSSCNSINNTDDICKLVASLELMVNGKECNYHLDSISNVIKRYFSVISIPSCIANPNYEWETIPRMIIVFDNKVAKEEVVLLRNLLKSFKGNCKWILTQKSFYHSNSYLLTVSGFNHLLMLNKKEKIQGALGDVYLLAQHIESYFCKRF